MIWHKVPVVVLLRFFFLHAYLVAFVCIVERFLAKTTKIHFFRRLLSISSLLQEWRHVMLSSIVHTHNSISLIYTLRGRGHKQQQPMTSSVLVCVCVCWFVV